jgi:aminoglycoside 6'-N-acetyltransferase
MVIAFRALAVEDLPLMHRWVSAPGLAEVWNQGEVYTYPEVEAKYIPYIRGEAPTRGFVILCDGEPIGYIQTYLWRDYPDYSQYMDLTEEAASLDVFIGEETYRHRGLGREILRAFLRDLVFAAPGVASCIITPEEVNAPALRAYAKAGFRHLRIMVHPEEPGPIALMRIGRDDV